MISGFSTASTHNQSSRTFTYEYGNNGLISKVTYPNGGSRGYKYANDGFPQALTSVTDEGQVRATWEYDGLGRAIGNELALGTDRTSLSFNADKSTTVTNSLGKASIYRFQNVAGSTRVASIEGQPSENCVSDSKSFTYTAAGRIESETDSNGTVTRYTYNDRGLVVQEFVEAANAPEKIILTEWHPELPRPIKIESPEQVEEFCYDEHGRLLQRVKRGHSEQALTCQIQ